MPIDIKLQAIKKRAIGLVAAAIRKGKLTRPDSCSLCDNLAKPIDSLVSRVNIVAHHWKGYEGESALDVLWICNRCNTILRAGEYHNGSFDLPELRQIIADYHANKAKVRQGVKSAISRHKREREALLDELIRNVIRK